MTRRAVIGVGRIVTPRQAFVHWCMELLAPLGTVRARAMFGGHGLYVDERFVGLIADEQLYLKADAVSAPRFEAAGCAAFVYTARGRPTTMSFWHAPAQAMDSPAGMAPWGRLALQAASRAAEAGSGRGRGRKQGSRP